MKKKKTITFMIASNQRGGTRRVVIPFNVIKASIAIAVVAAVAFSAAVIDYTGLLMQSNESERLRAENGRLKSQFSLVEGKLQSLESGLERLKRFSTKLNVITDAYGVQDRELHLAMGPLVKTGETLKALNQPIEERGGIEGIQAQDTFFNRPGVLDESKGEISSKGLRDYASLSIRIDQAIKGVALQEQGVIGLWTTLSEKESQLKSTPSIKPVRGWITSRFGYRMSPFTQKPSMHSGLDIAAAPGTEVRAPADGIVSFAGFDAAYGNLVSIDHGFGYKTRYGHNSKLFVRVGDKVRRGDLISSVGNTGRSTGPHLHYEVHINGIPMDPFHFILDE